MISFGIELGSGKWTSRRALLMAGILAVCCSLFSVPSSGQERRHGGGVERELNELTQVLTLTVDQQAQVKAVLVERREKMEALRDGDAQPTREQMRAVREDTNAKINALLKDDQKAKFAAWQQQQRMDRRGGGPGMEPPGL